MTDRDTWIKSAPDGWKQLVSELDTKLKERWPAYTIDQVKEKFGTLRFYANPGVAVPTFPDTDEGFAAYLAWRQEHTREFYDLIESYETQSATICQHCGKPGKLGDRNYWYSTLCTDCAPESWVPADNPCTHELITEDTCDTCGRTHIARLENNTVVLTRVHARGTCRTEQCTIHNRSDHPMRTYIQAWNEERGYMDRICPHGIGHPDPDDHGVTTNLPAAQNHDCDGCCASKDSGA